MKKRQTKVNLDNDTILHKVRLEFDKGAPEQKEILRQFFMQTVLGSPECWVCGPAKFDRMTITYDNGGWVVDTEHTERLTPSDVSEKSR